MKDDTYLLFQRCYLMTLGGVIGIVEAVYIMIKLYVTVSGVKQWEWIIGSTLIIICLSLIFIGIFGKKSLVEKWVDPFGAGDFFETVVIGIAFPLYSVVWLLRKVFLFR